MTEDSPLEVLIVEDNPADTYLINEAIHAEEPSCRTTAISDGDAAINYLSNARPDIVVLDLNIPRRDGVEVLRFIRGETRLLGVVVIIFSSSPKDAIERKAPQADAHIQKPFDLDLYMKVGTTIMNCFRESRPSSDQEPGL
jgi:CheY-like chemotaxis protein